MPIYQGRWPPIQKKTRKQTSLKIQFYIGILLKSGYCRSRKKQTKVKLIEDWKSTIWILQLSINSIDHHLRLASPVAGGGSSWWGVLLPLFSFRLNTTCNSILTCTLFFVCADSRIVEEYRTICSLWSTIWCFFAPPPPPPSPQTSLKYGKHRLGESMCI